MSQKVEVVKQVKLTPAQRIALMAAANTEGRLENVGYEVQVVLRHLGLIEERPRYSGKAAVAMRRAISEPWARVGAAVRKRDAREANRLLSDIQLKERRLEATAWWLTKAADEYLTHGRVVVTAGAK